MPRRPDGDVAMTSTERVRRFRERQRKANPAQTDRQKLAQERAENERLTKELAAAKRQEPARPVTNSASLVWQSSGDTHRAQRGGWAYFIRRHSGRQFRVAISHGRSLPDKLVDMPSLEQAKAHCAEHAARTGVTDAAEIARLLQLVSELEAKPPKPAAPPLDPDDEAARKIRTVQRKMGSGRWQAFKNKTVKALREETTTPASRLAALQAWNALGANKGKKAATRW